MQRAVVVEQMAVQRAELDGAEQAEMAVSELPPVVAQAAEAVVWLVWTLPMQPHKTDRSARHAPPLFCKRGTESQHPLRRQVQASAETAGAEVVAAEQRLRVSAVAEARAQGKH